MKIDVEDDEVGGQAHGDRSARGGQAEHAGRVRRRRGSCDLDRDAGVEDRPAQGVVHRECAAGKHARTRQPRLAVAHPHGLAAEDVVTVTGAGRIDGIGDQNEPMPIARDHPGDGRVYVHTVVDQLAGDVGVGAGVESGPDRARRSMVQRRHGVEQVGGQGRAGCERGDGLVVGGVGVPDRGHDAAVHGIGDDLSGAGQFRCDRDDAQRSPGRADQPGEHRPVRVEQMLRGLRATARGREERPLQMRPEHVTVGARTPLDQVGHP